MDLTMVDRKGRSENEEQPVEGPAHHRDKGDSTTFEVDERQSTKADEELNHLRDQAWGKYGKIWIWIG